MTTLRVHNLEGSPNNRKVMIALGFKGIEFEEVPVEFQGFPVTAEHRARQIEASGQPLAPVIEHGDTVLFDSAAILRYLDANFRDTPSIFAATYDGMKRIEEWELWGRSTAPAPVGMMFKAVMEERPAEVAGECNVLLQERAARIEEALGDDDYLCENRLTAADITIAPFLSYGMLSEKAASASPISAVFREHLDLGDHPRTRAWVDRVLAFAPGRVH